MIYGFVRQSGGQVRIYSELGKGTTMCLYFPRHLGAAEEECRAAPARPSEPAPAKRCWSSTTKPTVRMLICRSPEREPATKSLEAPDGPAALKILQSDSNASTC